MKVDYKKAKGFEWSLDDLKLSKHSEDFATLLLKLHRTTEQKVIKLIKEGISWRKFCGLKEAPSNLGLLAAVNRHRLTPLPPPWIPAKKHAEAFTPIAASTTASDREATFVQVRMSQNSLENPKWRPTERKLPGGKLFSSQVIQAEPSNNLPEFSFHDAILLGKV